VKSNETSPVIQFHQFCLPEKGILKRMSFKLLTKILGCAEPYTFSLQILLPKSIFLLFFLLFNFKNNRVCKWTNWEKSKNIKKIILEIKSHQLHIDHLKLSFRLETKLAMICVFHGKLFSQVNWKQWTSNTKTSRKIAS